MFEEPQRQDRKNPKDDPISYMNKPASINRKEKRARLPARYVVLSN
jgi:hypothetical protein